MKLKEKDCHAKCIRAGVKGLELGKVYEVFYEDEEDIVVLIDGQQEFVSKNCFEPYEEPVNLETIKKQIDELEKQLYQLKNQKEIIEKEEMKIEIGSIIREEGIFYEEAEEYRIVMIQPEPKREYKFGLLDKRSCIWNMQIFNSLEEIKKMMKEDKDLEWSVVKL